MWLIIIATFCISLSAGMVVDDKYTWVDDNEGPLLPKKYTVKARRTSITMNLVEDLVFWKTVSIGRIDQGYAKNIVKKIRRNGRYRKTGYEIHPRTDKDDNVEYECAKMDQDDVNGLKLDIPGFVGMDYEMKGNDTVLGQEATRFEYVDDYDDSDKYHYTLWAVETSVGDESVWAPLRYVVKDYNDLGALTNHEVWDFYEFGVDFDEHEVYDLKALGCRRWNMDEVTQDSGAVVKELKFIDPNNKKHVDHVFNSFKSKFNPKYAHEKEHNLRKTIFKQNMRRISYTNRQNLGYKLGVNRFADRTPEEMKKTGYRRRNKGDTDTMPFPYTQKTLDSLVDTLPEEVDLRVEGLVSPVKNQAECGSCWTFSTTTAAEGALARANGGRLMALSHQALIDCAWGYGSSGCDGSTDVSAYKWMMHYGLPTEEEYGPYLNKDGYCHINNMTTLYPIKGFTNVTPRNKEALKVAIQNHGPLSVAIDAAGDFSLYASGIFYNTKCSTNDLDHEVALVGYGVEYGELFWVLKNSWGPDWGVEGYMLISAKQDCGVTTEPTYVVF